MSRYEILIFNFRFIDSNQHLTASLDKLVKNLKSKGNQFFKYTKLFAGTNDKLDMLTRKGVYPYSYMDSFSKFNESKLILIIPCHSKPLLLQVSRLKRHSSTTWQSKSWAMKTMSLSNQPWLSSTWKRSVTSMISKCDGFTQWMTCMLIYGLLYKTNISATYSQMLHFWRMYFRATAFSVYNT